MKDPHSSKVFLPISLSMMVSWNSLIHVSLFYMSNSRVLFIDLMHSFRSCFSALLIICKPLDVITLVLSLILTGITSDLRHFKVNLRWFAKSAIFFSKFSKNSLLDQVLQQLGIDRIFSAPCHPQSNGKLEGFHKNYLKPTLEKLCEKDPSNWDTYFNQILASYSHTKLSYS